MKLLGIKSRIDLIIAGTIGGIIGSLLVRLLKSMI